MRSWGYIQASDITRVLLPPLTFAVVLSSHHVFALVACVHRLYIWGYVHTSAYMRTLPACPSVPLNMLKYLYDGG